MRQRLLLAALAYAGAAAVAQADEPAHPPGEACLTLDNRVLGPRSGDRPFPLYTRDALGFHHACDLPWHAISPQNRPVSVTDCCCQNSMLQVASESACGSSTGPLWVNSRWVVTSAQLGRPSTGAAICQQLETGTWAGTRDFQVDCIQKKKELQQKGVPALQAPAAAAAAPASSKEATPAVPPAASDK